MKKEEEEHGQEIRNFYCPISTLQVKISIDCVNVLKQYCIQYKETQKLLTYKTRENFHISHHYVKKNHFMTTDSQGQTNASHDYYITHFGYIS